MAQRKRKASPKDNAPEPPVGPAETQTSIDGALVRVVDEELTIQSLGQTRPLEVPTLLRKAAKAVERELGID